MSVDKTKRSASQDQYIVRLPDGMRDRLKAEAAENNRSMNAEIVARLEAPTMTLRDYFAAQALVGFLANGSQRKIAQAIEEGDNANLIQDTKARTTVVNGLIAEGVYALADAMLAERSK